jgi:hypothetical protein
MEEFIIQPYEYRGNFGHPVYTKKWYEWAATHNLNFASVGEHNKCLKQYNANLKLSRESGLYDIQFNTKEDMVVFALRWM